MWALGPGMPEHNLALLKYTFSIKVGMGSILDIK